MVPFSKVFLNHFFSLWALVSIVVPLANAQQSDPVHPVQKTPGINIDQTVKEVCRAQYTLLVDSIRQIQTETEKKVKELEKTLENTETIETRAKHDRALNGESIDQYQKLKDTYLEPFRKLMQNPEFGNAIANLTKYRAAYLQQTNDLIKTTLKEAVARELAVVSRLMGDSVNSKNALDQFNLNSYDFLQSTFSNLTRAFVVLGHSAPQNGWRLTVELSRSGHIDVYAVEHKAYEKTGAETGKLVGFRIQQSSEKPTKSEVIGFYGDHFLESTRWGAGEIVISHDLRSPLVHFPENESLNDISVSRVRGYIQNQIRALRLDERDEIFRLKLQISICEKDQEFSSHISDLIEKKTDVAPTKDPNTPPTTQKNTAGESK